MNDVSNQPSEVNCAHRTVLASSAYDGRVRLWKRTDGKIWRGQGWVTGETHHLLDAEGHEQLDELRGHQHTHSHDI